jgi:hypothetical protein
VGLSIVEVGYSTINISMLRVRLAGMKEGSGVSNFDRAEVVT